MDVLDAKEHLLAVVLGDRYRERARVCDVIKNLPVLNQLLSNIGSFNLFTILFNHCGIFLEVKVFDYVLVLETLNHFNFFFETRNIRLIVVYRVVFRKNFHGEFRTIFGRA